MSFTKGVSATINVRLVKTDGSNDTVSTPSVYISKDNGHFSAVAASPAQLTLGGSPSNTWSVVLSADEMAADYIDILAQADGCVDDRQTIVPTTNYTEARGALLSNLDAAVTSRATAADVPSAATTAQAVWEYSTRTLSSFGTLVADIATAVWGATTRTLSSFGTLASAVTTIRSLLRTATLSPTGAVAGGDITLYKGADYVGSDCELDLDSDDYGDLTDATVALVTDDDTIAGEIVNGGTNDQAARFEMTAEETAALTDGEYSYELQVTTTAGKVLPPQITGTMYIRSMNAGGA